MHTHDLLYLSKQVRMVEYICGQKLVVRLAMFSVFESTKVMKYLVSKEKDFLNKKWQISPDSIVISNSSEKVRMVELLSEVKSCW